MSARALPFLVVPLFIMMGAILMNSGNASVNGTNTAQFCNAPNAGCPPPGASGTLYACQPASLIGNLQACKILPNCNAPPYLAPAFCIGDIFTAISAGCFLQ